MLTEPTTKIELSLNSEFPSYPRDASTEVAYFNCNLRAPMCPDSDRKPVDIVVVLDRSGSMSGSKLDLCKKTIQFLMGELSALDRLGLITYDSQVKTEFPLMRMDEKGKEQTERILKTIHPGSTTNLSGGLMAGIQEVQKPARKGGFWSRKDETEEPNPVRSVLILTDGLANNGVTSVPKIVQLVKGSLEPNVNIFTFGYGSDHNEDMLREISEVGGGVYYFVQNVDGVSQAFADCLGGLLSVVAQNIKMECFGKNGCKIQAIKTRKAMNAIVPEEHYEIEMGDIYGEEERDVLIEVSMPALPMENKEFVALECRLNYANVLDSSLDKLQVSLAVQRLSEVPKDQVPDSHITQQRNRIISAEALERANAEAEKGRLDEGKVVLQKAQAHMMGSLKYLDAGEKEATSALMNDLTECEGTMANLKMYHHRGKKRMKAKVQSHWAQRSNDAEVEEEDIASEMMLGSARALPLAGGMPQLGGVSSAASGYRTSRKSRMLAKTYGR